jgi:hypothetical protein
MHVLEALTDLLSLQEIKPSSGAGSAHPIYDVLSDRNLAPEISISSPQETKLGDQHLQALVTIFEPSPSVPGDTEVKGRGYRLILPKPDTSGKAQWNVQFPKYPYPAEKL